MVTIIKFPNCNSPLIVKECNCLVVVQFVQFVQFVSFVQVEYFVFSTTLVHNLQLQSKQVNQETRSKFSLQIMQRQHLNAKHKECLNHKVP